MSTPSTTHIRNLLNLFNSILEGGDPIGIFQEQIAHFERNFTTPTQPLYLYIDLPKEDPQTSFAKSTFTLASPTPLTPPGLRLDVYCPCIDLGSSGVVLPRGIEFSAYTSFDPPTRRVSFPSQAKDCKGMDEKECKNNPDICIYRRVKGGKRRCTARRGTLKPGALRLRQGLLDEIKPPLRQGLLTLFKPRILEYLPDLIGTTSDDTTHVLPHDHTHFNDYRHIEVVKRFTITEDTNFSRSLVSIVGGGVRLVGNMIYKFWNLTLFNSPVDRWDVSKVTHMSRMFHGAIAFNQPLEIWNVSGVTDMYGMFQITEAFNQPLEEWNVSGVAHMDYMFWEATAFNQPLEQWNVSGVTDMHSMFQEATTFNQPLERWNVSGVTDMHSMFSDAIAFNQPLERWDVSGVTDMHSMFSEATTFNQPIGQWDVSGVTDMSYMFSRASNFNKPIGEWNTRTVIYMDNMFDGSGMENIPQWYTDFYNGYW